MAAKKILFLTGDFAEYVRNWRPIDNNLLGANY